MANTVKYGLKNVYYAVATLGTSGAYTYTAPVAWPGAVSLSLDAEGGTTKFRADNVDYWVGQSNNGYSGDFESALIPDGFRTAVLGDIVPEESGTPLDIMIEDADAKTKYFALLFQFEGDQKAVKHVLYNCTATRPAIGSATKEDTVEPETETVTITATSIYSETLQSDIVKARSNKDTDGTTYDAWFNTVYLPT